MEQKQLDELTATLGDIQSGVDNLRGSLQAHDDELGHLRRDLDLVRRGQAHRAAPAARPGQVSDDCARHLAAVVIAGALKAGRLARPNKDTVTCWRILKRLAKDIYQWHIPRYTS